MPTAPVATSPLPPVARFALGLAALLTTPPAAGAQPSPVDRLVLRFDAAGACVVEAGPSGASGTPGGAWRCDLAGLAPKRTVALTVALPPGMAPVDTSFPRLQWTAQARGAVGTAMLPAAPAFVHVAPDGAAGAVQGRWLDVLALAATSLAVAWSLVYGRRA